MYELHDSPIGGHHGVSKTFNRIKIQYYWENLKEDIQRRIQQCLKCQLKKLTRLKIKQPMVITDTPGTVFDKIAMDIVGTLQKTKTDFEYILTMQDQLSKFCLAPLKNTLATTIADAFIKKFICIFGAPRIILTNQGRNFFSRLMERVSKRFKIKKIRTTAFHPQSNGSLERSHHALGEYLKQYTSTDANWDEWLDLAMLNYNTCVSESTVTCRRRFFDKILIDSSLRVIIYNYPAGTCCTRFILDTGCTSEKGCNDWRRERIVPSGIEMPFR